MSRKSQKKSLLSKKFFANLPSEKNPNGFFNFLSSSLNLCWWKWKLPNKMRNRCHLCILNMVNDRDMTDKKRKTASKPHHTREIHSQNVLFLRGIYMKCMLYKWILFMEYFYYCYDYLTLIECVSVCGMQ